ncbi:MAG: DUF3256 family protein [Bacteroidales bacterium]|nr:DUF3256 family protein [Bacteroidales bacterium]
MKRFVLTLFLLAVLSLHAQDMKNLFVNMPEAVAPLLTKVNREDCVDFLNSHMKAVVKNKLGGKSELQQLTDNYFLMQLTEVSTLQAKLLPLNDSINMLCVVKTNTSPIPDSTIRFYDTDWQILPMQAFPDSIAYYSQMQLSAKEPLLILTNRHNKVNPDTYAMTIVADTLTFRWSSRQFVRQ